MSEFGELRRAAVSKLVDGTTKSLVLLAYDDGRGAPFEASVLFFVNVGTGVRQYLPMKNLLSFVQFLSNRNGDRIWQKHEARGASTLGRLD